MRRNKATTFLILLLMTLAAHTLIAQPHSLRGKIIGADGTPATGLEVSLQYKDKELARTYTNDEGFYAFFEIAQPFQDLKLVVSEQSSTLKQVTITTTYGKGVVPDIVLDESK